MHIYIIWILIVICPLMIGITLYFVIRKKGTKNNRRRLIYISIILLIVTIFQLAASIYRKNLVEDMPREEIYK
jgi:Mn2+/Fe2+ NRAMP family transporter